MTDEQVLLSKWSSLELQLGPCFWLRTRLR